jgi:DNA-binding NarL/FixJ family response regulator
VGTVTVVAPPVDIALANDFELVVIGLARLLSPYEDRVQVRDVVVRGDPIREAVDVLLFDVFAHPDLGFTEIAPLVRDPNVAHVAVFTWQLDDATLERGFELGVSGYLAKNLSALELVVAIERIAAGERLVTGHAGSDHHTTGRDWPGRAEGLSERESEVVILIAEGYTNAEIATALHLSINSVKTHVRSAYRKLAVQRRSQAVRKVMDLGLARRSVDRARWNELRSSAPTAPGPMGGDRR